MFDLAGKVAVVTGGGSGIGLATVRRLARADARVVIADVTDQAELAAEVAGLFVPTDVADDASTARLMATAAQWGGRIDAVVCSAGIALGTDTVDVEPDRNYVAQFEVNVLGVVHCIRQAVPFMSGGGSIVTIASLAGVSAYPTYASYSVSKFGAVGVSLVAAVELGRRQIRVNALCPAGVETPMGNAVPAESDPERAFQELVPPIARYASADEIAAAVHFLIADDCAFITGQAIRIDGGMSTGPALEFVTGLLPELHDGPE